MDNQFSKKYTPNARSQPILPNSEEDDSLEDKFARKKRDADLSSSTLRLMAKQAKPENIGRLNQKADTIQNRYDYDFKKAKGELTPQNAPENYDVSDMSYKKGGKVNMPSTSKKQHNFMEAIAHNSGFAKKVGIPQSVGMEFSKADKGRKFKEGGTTMKNSDLAQDKKMIKRAIGMHDKQEHPGKKTNLAKLKKGGMPFEMSFMDKEKKGMKEGSKAEEAMDKKQMMKKYAKGGMIASSMGKVASGSKRPHGEHGIQTKGHTKGTNIKMRGC